MDLNSYFFKNNSDELLIYCKNCGNKNRIKYDKNKNIDYNVNKIWYKINYINFIILFISIIFLIIFFY